MAFTVNPPSPSLAPLDLASAANADLPAGAIYLHNVNGTVGSGISADMLLWSKNAGAVSYVSSPQSPADKYGLNAIGTFGDATGTSLNETPAGRQTSVGAMSGTISLGLVASPVPQADLAAGISVPNRRYEAVDAYMAQNSLGDIKADKAGIPALPDSEKTDVTLRAEALAAIVLMFGRGRLADAKSQRNTADDNRWRVLFR
jgi:hypothetical protein